MWQYCTLSWHSRVFKRCFLKAQVHNWTNRKSTTHPALCKLCHQLAIMFASLGSKSKLPRVPSNPPPLGQRFSPGRTGTYRRWSCTRNSFINPLALQNNFPAWKTTRRSTRRVAICRFWANLLPTGSSPYVQAAIGRRRRRSSHVLFQRAPFGCADRRRRWRRFGRGDMRIDTSFCKKICCKRWCQKQISNEDFFVNML